MGLVCSGSVVPMCSGSVVPMCSISAGWYPTSVGLVCIGLELVSSPRLRFAYIEFGEKEAVDKAMELHESLFKGRQIKVGGADRGGRGYRQLRTGTGF